MNVNTMNKAGFAIMALGFLAGAYFLVEHPREVSWLHYGVSLAVTVAGAVMLRLARSQAGGETSKVTSDIDTIRASLKTLVERVRHINNADRDGAKVFDVCSRIDADCIDPINDFVEAREAMIHRFGLSHYAAMMDSFALGERALNRAWCASADGYIDEVNLCLARAESYLDKALCTVEECHGAQRDVGPGDRDTSSESKAT